MGMYDYLNGNQVKCFPVAIVYDGNRYGENAAVGFSTMGGLLRGFGTGDKVPYSTSIYNYGKDFIVFDYKGSTLDEYTDEKIYSLYIIENGIVKEEIVVDLEDKEIISKLSVIGNIQDKVVIGVHSENIKLVKIDELLEIIVEYKETMDKYLKELRQIQPLFHEYIEKLRKDIEDNELKSEYDTKLTDLRNETINKFHKRWLNEKDFFSNTIGFFIENLNSKEYHIDVVEKAKKLLKAYKEQDIEKYEKEVLEYKEWVEGYMTSEEVDILFNNI